ILGALPSSHMHWRVAAWLVRQLAPALRKLYRSGGAHGILTADRIIVTPEGSLAVVDHALGASVEQLHLSAARLWKDFGVLAPDALAGRFDDRSDMVQLASIV